MSEPKKDKRIRLGTDGKQHNAAREAAEDQLRSSGYPYKDPDPSLLDGIDSVLNFLAKHVLPTAVVGAETALGYHDGLPEYWKDVRSRGYRWHDTRSMEDVGRIAYVAKHTGVLAMMAAGRSGAQGGGQAEMREAATKLLISQLGQADKGDTKERFLDLYESPQAAHWREDPELRNLINTGPEVVLGFWDPTGALLMGTARGAARELRHAKMGGMLDKLIASKPSVEKVARTFITELEGASIGHQGFLNDLHKLITAGDKKAALRYMDAVGAWPKSVLTQAAERWPKLDFFRLSGRVETIRSQELAYNSDAIRIMVEHDTEKALVKSAELNKMLDGLSPHDLDAFVLINGSEDYFRAYQKSGQVGQGGHSASPELAAAVKKMREVVGYDAGARLQKWPLLKESYAKKMGAEMESLGNRSEKVWRTLADDLGELHVAGADTPAGKDALLRIEGHKNELAAIEDRVEVIASERVKLLSSESPKLMDAYTARLGLRRTDPHLVDDLDEVYVRLATPGYEKSRSGAALSPEAVRESYSGNHPALLEDLKQLYQNVATRAARETAVASYAKLLDRAVDTLHSNAVMAQQAVPGSREALALEREGRALNAVIDDSIRHMERLPRPPAGQVSASEMLAGSEKRWDDYWLRLRALQKDYGASQQVMVDAQLRYEKIKLEIREAGVTSKVSERRIAAAEKQQDVVWDSFRREKENLATIKDKAAATRKDAAELDVKLRAEHDAKLAPRQLERQGGLQEKEALRRELSQLFNEKRLYEKTDEVKLRIVQDRISEISDVEAPAVQEVLTQIERGIKAERTAYSRAKRQVRDLRNKARGFDTAVREKQESMSLLMKRASDIKADIAKLKKAADRGKLFDDLGKQAGKAAAARLANKADAKVLAHHIALHPKPESVKEALDLLADGLQTILRLEKVNWLFFKPFQFLVQNMDNYVKNVGEIPHDFAPNGMRLTGEPLLYPYRTGFLEDTAKADLRGKPGKIEQALSSIREGVPLPWKGVDDLIGHQESSSKGLLMDWAYQKKANELIATGATDKAAIDAQAYAFANEEVGRVQFGNTKLRPVGKAIEFMFPFSRYGKNAIEYSVDTFIHRPAYIRNLLNIQQAAEATGITHDGRLDLGNGASVNPTQVVGMAQTLEFMDSIRFSTEGGVYFQKKALDYTIQSDPQSFSYASADERDSVQRQALASMQVRGAPVRPNPLFKAGIQMLAPGGVEFQQAAAEAAKGVFSPQESVLKIAGIPGGFDELAWRMESNNPEDRTRYRELRAKDVQTEFKMGGQEISLEQADTLFQLRTSANNLTRMLTGVDLQMRTRGEDELRRAKDLFYSVPVEWRKSMRQSGAENLWWTKQLPLYRSDERRAILDKVDGADRQEMQRLLKESDYEDKLQMLRGYPNKSVDSLPTGGDSSMISDDDWAKAMAATPLGRIFAPLLQPKDAVAGPVKRIEDASPDSALSQATETKNALPVGMDTRRALFQVAGEQATFEQLADLVVNASGARDPVAARAQAIAVLTAIQAEPQMQKLGVTARGGSPILSDKDGKQISGWEFVTRVPKSGIQSTDARNELVVQLAQINAQTRWAGLADNFNEVAANGNKDDLYKLRSDPRYAEFTTKGGKWFGGDILARQRVQSGDLSSQQAALKLWLDTDSVPVGMGIRLEKKAFDTYPELGYHVGQLQDALRDPRKMSGAIGALNAAVAAGDRVPPNAWSVIEDSPNYRNLYANIGVTSTFEEARPLLSKLVRADKSGRPTIVNPAALFQAAFGKGYEDLRPYVQAARTGSYGQDIKNSLENYINTLPENVREQLDRFVPADTQFVQAFFDQESAVAIGDFRMDSSTKDFLDILGVPQVRADMGRLPQGQFTAQEPSPVTAGYVPASARVAALTAAPITGVGPDSSSSVGGFMRTLPSVPELAAHLPPYKPAPTSAREIAYNAVNTATRERYEYRQSMAAYTAGGSVGTPPQVPQGALVNFGAELSETMADPGISAGSKASIALQSIALANSAAQGVYSDLQKTGDVSGEGAGAAAMYGLNNFASTYTNPGGMLLNAGTLGAYGLYVGIKSGLNFGKRDDRAQQNYNENFRINQERLELERERFNEQLRQTSIRDIRQRESDIAQALRGGASIDRRGPVEARLAAFTRRPTYSSRIGLVDAVERAVAASIKPKW